MSMTTFLRLLPRDLETESADGWLTTRTVEGYRDEDFAFLPTDERVRLKKSVACFRAEVSVTDVGTAKRPATDDEIRRARPFLENILDIVAPDRYADADALRLGKQIEAIVGWRTTATRLPQWVKELKFETGKDHTGDPAIWVWVISDDAIFDSAAFSDGAANVRSILFAAAREVDDSRWPFVRLRSVSDERLLLQETGQ